MALMTCNQAGIDLIKQFEGCRLHSYQDQRGIWTIGYGATGSDIGEGLIWNQYHADERLADDIVIKAETPINRLVHSDITLTPNQFSALCSLCYNIGQGNFASSSALSLINGGTLDTVPDHILLWDEIDGHKSLGLLRRRQAEVALWLAP